VSFGLSRPPEPAYASIGIVTSMRPGPTRACRCVSSVDDSSWPPLSGTATRWPTTWSVWSLLNVVAATSCGRLTRATLRSSARKTASAGRSCVTRSTACVLGPWRQLGDVLDAVGQGHRDRYRADLLLESARGLEARVVAVQHEVHAPEGAQARHQVLALLGTDLRQDWLWRYTKKFGRPPSACSRHLPTSARPCGRSSIP